MGVNKFECHDMYDGGYEDVIGVGPHLYEGQGPQGPSVVEQIGPLIDRRVDLP